MQPLRYKVMVIDDDLAILEVIQIILQEKGYDVHTVSDSTTVEKEIESYKPHIVLVDFWMAGLNGRKVVTKLKQNNATKHIPIIMISANHEVEKIAEEVQADDFLAKPFDIDDLITIVNKHITLPPNHQ